MSAPGSRTGSRAESRDDSKGAAQSSRASHSTAAPERGVFTEPWTGPRRKRRRGGGLATIGELVPRVLKNEPDDAILFRVMALWERALPHRMVQNARPTAIRKGILYVAATTSAWAQEVTFRTRDILDKVHRGVPRATITQMRVRTGRLPERIVPAPRVLRSVIPLAKLPDTLAISLENMSDPKLRALFDGAIRTSLGKVVEHPPET